MEACLKESYGGSQDSLLSTGSIQELKTQLDSTIARVDGAITTVIEQQKTKTSSLNGNETGARFRQPAVAAARRLSVEGVAPASKTLPRCSQDPKLPDKRGSAVMLKTSSWASRDLLKPPSDEGGDVTVQSAMTFARRNSNVAIGGKEGEEEEEEEEKPFAKARDLWERRTSFQGSVSKSARDPPDEGGDCSSAAAATTKAEGFRNNKDFWEQRVTVRQKQTPDLVMDLPLSTSPKGGGGGGNSSVVIPVAPQPRPRKTSASRPHAADNAPAPISKEKDSGQAPVAPLLSPPKARARKSLGRGGGDGGDGVNDEQDVSTSPTTAATSSRK